MYARITYSAGESVEVEVKVPIESAEELERNVDKYLKTGREMAAKLCPKPPAC